MNKQEALDKIEELKAYVKGCDKEILVPECIGLVSKGILFGDKQLLHIDNRAGNNSYDVGSKPTGRNIYNDDEYEPAPHKLIKCSRSDLKRGDIAYRTDYLGKVEIKDIERYCVIVNNHEYVYANRYGVSKRDSKFRHWYKAVRV